MVKHIVTAKDRKDAEEYARAIKEVVYNDRYKVTDIVYIKGSKRDTVFGKGLKRYGIIFEKKKKLKKVM